MEKEGSKISPVIAIIAVAVTFMLSLFVGTAFYLLFGIGFTLVFGELLIVVVPLGYMLYKRINISSYVGLNINLRNALLGLAFGAFLFVFGLFVSAAIISILGESAAVRESNTMILDLTATPQGILLLIAALSLAGVCEEFTFRGFLQKAVNSKYSFKIAVLVSSLAFGLFHLDPQGTYSIWAFFIGLLLGYIYHRTGSYLTSAVAHATLNLIGLAVIFLV